MEVNDNAYFLIEHGAHVGASLLAMVVNDNAYVLIEHGAHVGASLLAMEVNDNACFLIRRGALRSIVGTPPGASSLLHTHTTTTRVQT